MCAYRPVALAAGCLVFSNVMMAQFGRGGSTPWNVAGADAQRSSWIVQDSRIAADKMSAFDLLWKVKVNNEARQNYSVSPAAMVDSYIGYRGFRSYAFVGGASNNVVAFDSDIGRVEWTQNLGAAPTGGTASCPGAMSGGISRTAALTPGRPNAPAGGGGGGRGRGAASGVSDPDQGAITIGQGRGGGFGGPGGGGAGRGGDPAAGRGAGGNGAPVAGPPGAPGAPGAGAPGAGRGGPGGGRGGGGGGFGGRGQFVYAVPTDGMLHTMYISNGTAAKPPVRFLPANANASGLMLYNNILYVATSGNCGGVANGIWAIDTSATDAVPVHWATNGGGIAGSFAMAIGTDNTVYAATTDGDYTPVALSDSVVALDPKTLHVKDFFTPGKSEFTSSPVVFSYGGKDVIVAANRDGHLYLLDSAALGGADHKTPLAQSPQYANSGAGAGALASWEDASGNRWVLVSVNGGLSSTARFNTTNGAVTSGAVAAFKIVDQNGKPAFQPAWVSHDIASPLPPIIVNDVVIALSTGSSSKPAVLYVLDGASGKELYNSGTTIATYAHSTGALSASAGQVYLSTADSTVYAFGIPLVSKELQAKNK